MFIEENRCALAERPPVVEKNNAVEENNAMESRHGVREPARVQEPAPGSRYAEYQAAEPAPLVAWWADDGVRAYREESLSRVGTELSVPIAALSPLWWRLVQRAIAAALLVGLSPVYLFIALSVRLTSRGPIFFPQVRRGFMGKPFTIRKFRTMAEGRSSESALVVQCSDPRVTKVGRILRFTKLDEIPQLWNVARGDMELIGPRPIPLNLEGALLNDVKGFRIRYYVKPGLSNLSQIAIDDNAVGYQGMLHDWHARFRGELSYIDKKSVGEDCYVVYRTVLFLLRRFVLGSALRFPKRVMERTTRSIPRDSSEPLQRAKRDGSKDRVASAP